MDQFAQQIPTPVDAGFPSMQGGFQPSFDNLFSDPLFDAGGELPDHPPLKATTPIELQGEEFRRFLYRFQTSLENAISKMETIHEEVRHDRKIYKMMPRKQEYKGQPNITTPVSANKVDGVVAHIRDAIEQHPFVTFQAEGMGKTAEMAAQIAPVLEAYFEREINLSGSRRYLAMEAPREAITVGTAIPKLSIAEHPNGEHFVQVGELVMMENFFVDRISANDLRHTFCAYREKKRWYQLDELAQDGYLDKEGVEKLRSYTSASADDQIPEEEEKRFNEDSFWEEESVLHTIWTAYMRYRPKGEKRAVIYEVVFHRESRTVLALRVNPYSRAFDAPPLGLLRVGKTPNYLFGRGIVRRLAPIQHMADNSLNNHLALNNLAANPPFVYDATSAFGQFLERNGARGLRPGIGIPAIGDLGRNGIHPVMMPNPGLNLQDFNVFHQFASEATYTEEAIGSSSDRKTLGQFQIEVQRGTIRLRLDLTDLAYDYAHFMTMYWAMVNAFKIAPAGIVEVEKGGKLIASRSIGRDELQGVIQPLIERLMQSGQIDMFDLDYQTLLDQEINALLTADSIPSSRRQDLSISLTGTRIIADKVAELQLLFQLTPYITTMIDAARQDSYYNYHLRTIIEAMGFKDVNRRIPRDPGTYIQDPMQRQEATAAMNSLYSSMSAI